MRVEDIGARGDGALTEDDQAKDFFCPGAAWKRVLVYAVVKHEEELAEFERQGIQLVPLERVLKVLCPPTRPAFTASAGTDLWT